MRSIWKGVISFGLVNIPVRLYRAVEERSVHFRQLHAACGTPIRYRRWCPRCEVEAGPEDLARGYEYAPDRFVLIEDEDLERLPLPTARAVEILDFVRLHEIDPIYFERTYYLEPVEGGEKAYALLRRAMDVRRCVAVAKVALRHKESLCCLRTYEGRVLALATMAYPDEIRPVEALPGLARLPRDDAATARAGQPAGDRNGLPAGANGAASPAGPGGAGVPGTAAVAGGGGIPPGASLPGGAVAAGSAGTGAAGGETGAAGAGMDRELELALHLIDRLTTTFDPRRYRDRYREALMELVERKLAGQDGAVVRPEPAPVIDLMEALRASLEQAERRQPVSAR
ncbi:MAG TPA: Ku protein [Thermaerobacter sp.]